LSDTPRTDDILSGQVFSDLDGAVACLNQWVDHSRQIERELARLQAIFDAATEVQGDAEVLRYVTSGNAIPVTRCTVSADLIRQLVAGRTAAQQEDTNRALVIDECIKECLKEASECVHTCSDDWQNGALMCARRLRELKNLPQHNHGDEARRSTSAGQETKEKA
jgi:hypothetical protein